MCTDPDIFETMHAAHEVSVEDTSNEDRSIEYQCSAAGIAKIMPYVYYCITELKRACLLPKVGLVFVVSAIVW